MSLTNPYGDVELQPQAMRALAHPVRLAILSRLQRHGPSTASRLSPDVGATPSVTSWHLRHLASFGLVRDSDVGEDARERWWESVGRGFRLTPPDPRGQRRPSGVPRARRADVPPVPRPAPDLARATSSPACPHAGGALSGLANTRIVVGRAELARIEQAIEEVLAPYVRRDAADAPRGSRGVRLMRYVMPEAPESP